MGTKNKGGRPKISWDEKQWKQFKTLCSMQCTQEEICAVMGVTDKTLTRLLNDRYKNESFSEIYKRESASGKASLRRIQFDIAKKGNATMAIFLGKNYLGQSDKQEYEDVGEKEITINVMAATPEDIESDDEE